MTEVSPQFCPMWAAMVPKKKKKKNFTKFRFRAKIQISSDTGSVLPHVAVMAWSCVP